MTILVINSYHILNNKIAINQAIIYFTVILYSLFCKRLILSGIYASYTTIEQSMQSQAKPNSGYLVKKGSESGK